MNIDMRRERSITTPRIGAYELSVGWECKRPFLSVRRYVVEPDGFNYDERVVFVGGCSVWRGPDCVNECDGCIAYESAFTTDFNDDMSTDEEDDLYDEATCLADTIGHGARCITNEDKRDGCKATRE